MLTMKQARRVADLTQREVADSLGICVESYRRIERKPELATMEQAVKFCRLVNQSLDAISFLP